MYIVKGNPPNVGYVLAENSEWVLYEVVSKGDDWLNLKLVSKQPRQKANFWLAWSSKEKRFARTATARLLVEHYPEVEKWVQDALPARDLA